MASCQTSRWVSTAPYVKLTLTQSGSTDTSVTFDWTLQYISDYAANTNGVGRPYTVKIGGTTVKEGTYDIDGVTGTKTIASGTKTISKTTAAQTIAFSVSFTFNLTWSGSYKGSLSASGSVSVPAKTSYTVSYNANGGTGAPGAQTKWYGTALTLSGTKPTRAGYEFDGWATSASGSVAYVAGASYTANANVTLYAVWKSNTYKVTYNANGGSGAPSAQTKTYGVNLTLSSTKPTRANYTFKGWATSASSTTVAYAAGATYKANAAITLYAVWELAYTKPRITNISVARCEANNTVSDTGTYVRVGFSWACDRDVSSIRIEWKLSTSKVWTNSVDVQFTSGTSGSTTQRIGDGSIDIEHSYDLRIVVDDAGGESEQTRRIPSVKFAFDSMPDNKGIAFGKAAELENHADFEYFVRLRNNMTCNNGVGMWGKTTDDVSLSLAYVNGSNNSVFGYGSYSNKVGNTNLYGNSVRMTSHNGIFADGCRLASNKVLWSGSYYMSEAQTITLNEAISKQANGIVLIWCEYTDGEAVNANFNMQFVPKYFVSEYAARGVGTVITSATMNVMATKYVYISDTSIAGYATNNAAAEVTACGVTRTSKNFILRAVIGV